MQAVLLGYRKVDFVDKKTEQPIIGTKIFLGYQEPNVVGLNIDSCWVSYKNSNCICLDLSANIGKKIDVEMNFKGHVIGISVWEDEDVA